MRIPDMGFSCIKWLRHSVPPLNWQLCGDLEESIHNADLMVDAVLAGETVAAP